MTACVLWLYTVLLADRQTCQYPNVILFTSFYQRNFQTVNLLCTFYEKERCRFLLPESLLMIQWWRYNLARIVDMCPFSLNDVLCWNQNPIQTKLPNLNHGLGRRRLLSPRQQGLQNHPKLFSRQNPLVATLFFVFWCIYFLKMCHL